MATCHLSHLANRSQEDIQELYHRPEPAVPQSPVDVFCWLFAIPQEIVPMILKRIKSFTEIILNSHCVSCLPNDLLRGTSHSTFDL